MRDLPYRPAQQKSVILVAFHKKDVLFRLLRFLHLSVIALRYAAPWRGKGCLLISQARALLFSFLCDCRRPLNRVLQPLSAEILNTGNAPANTHREFFAFRRSHPSPRAGPTQRYRLLAQRIYYVDFPRQCGLHPNWSDDCPVRKLR